MCKQSQRLNKVKYFVKQHSNGQYITKTLKFWKFDIVNQGQGDKDIDNLAENWPANFLCQWF